jgi:hypothetical protein
MLDSPSMVVRQIIPRGTAISWCLNRTVFLDAAASLGFGIVQEIHFQDDFVAIEGAAHLPAIRGYLFKRRLS